MLLIKFSSILLFPTLVEEKQSNVILIFNLQSIPWAEFETDSI